ncbi:anti-sigma factor family protein [Yinghuangia seranimata]|uniref:anti-sigma factor family protein n=1 Tax=Yinghuangia seranimata TaxID=408067 RepID=UPI00248B055C|nr:zf-HC2 domain-containing protein [Yinghuangia seranimata]MDI2129200.1 zf-HC2 domain-containing protein [Yinghuangia seranimata]
MTDPVEHTDVAAYALGLLDPGESAAFEAHLAGCARCRHELGELGDTAALLALSAEADADVFGPPGGRVDEAAAARFRAAVREEVARGEEPDLFVVEGAVEGTVGGPVDLAAYRRTRLRRRVALSVAGAAAAAVLVVSGVALGGGFGAEHRDASAHPSADLPMTGERHPGQGVAGGVDGSTGFIAVESRGWGSHIGLQLSGVRGPLRCDMIAVGKDGSRETIGNWQVPPAGYGTPEHPDPLTFHGGSSMPAAALDHVEVRTSDGRLLLDVPM